MAVKDHGYLLEVDVNYPRELHDYHNDLPFMCEKMKVGGVEKLVPNLYYKMKYVIHIKADWCWNIYMDYSKCRDYYSPFIL